MKKLFPLAIIGAAVGAAGYFLNRNNKNHVEKTLSALDDLSASAENTVTEFADELSKEDSE
ncbi:MAG: hypothetical protein GX233_01950 [Erysipelothrix sp.]|nr:hypothetical protein [Erysipelothrix sp.]